MATGSDRMETFAQAAPDLLPVLRPIDRLRDGVARVPFAPGLALAVVLDLPEIRRFVHEEHLAQWGVPLETALAEACGNLHPHDGLRLRDGVWSVETGDGYESSRLALPGWLAAFRGQVEGAPVAFAPHARALWVCGEADADELRPRAEAAYRTEGDPITPAALTLTPDGHLTLDP